jgi:exosortase
MLAALPLAELINRLCESELRHASAAVAAALLSGIGVPVDRQGTVLETPRGRFAVLLPCSGGKFLSVTLALGASALALGKARGARRLLVLAALVPLAIAGNAVRVTGLVLAGPDYTPALHTVLGLACFASVGFVTCWAAGLYGAGERSGTDA